jgi:hypothetical protein
MVVMQLNLKSGVSPQKRQLRFIVSALLNYSWARRQEFSLKHRKRFDYLDPKTATTCS